MAMQIARHSKPLSLKTVRPTVIPDSIRQLRLFNPFKRWVQARRAIHQLSAMSESNLKDLGYPTHRSIWGDEKRR